MSHVFPTYGRWEVEIAAGNGTYVTDVNGKQYLDFVSGIAVSNLGHSHPVVLSAVQEQLTKVWHVSNLFQNSLQEEVAALLTEHSDGQRVFFCNSGAEANEAAIKLARKFTGKHKIITFQQSFHGRTFATMSATGQAKIHSGFGPLVSEFAYVPYNDIAALEAAMDETVAAVLVEAVQGEGGVLPAEPAFMQAIQELCQQHNALFMIDEVQSGIGRTGKPFAYQHYGVSPDIITTAKALGNGIPVGAMIGKEYLVEAFGPGVHGSTFGGNMTAMAAAKAVLQTIFNPQFLEETTAKSERFLALLQQELSDSPYVKEIRGKGFMLGVVCGQEAVPFIAELRECGLLVLNAGPNVIRLLPPLTVQEEELQQAVQMMKHVLCKGAAV